MKREIVCVIVILLIAAMIISGCGGRNDSNITETFTSTTSTSLSTTETSPSETVPTTNEPESYINLISVNIVSELSKFDTVNASIIRFNLEGVNKVFLTLNFWRRPSSGNITINSQDIVVVSSTSQRYYPVGFGAGEYMEEVFNSGNASLEFSLTSVLINMDLYYSSNNSYGIYSDRISGTYHVSGGVRITMQLSPSFVIAYVVTRESIENNSFWLEVPNSPLIKLSLPQT